MRTTRLQPDSLARAFSACALLLCLLLVAAHARVVLGQAVVGQAAVAAAPPKEVADFFIKLLTARQVDVKKLLGTTPAELPFFRLRLYVAPTVPGPSGQAGQSGPPSLPWAGIDYHLHRDAKETHRIELAAPKGLFRASLNQALRDPSSAPTDPAEAGVRIVDVWCQHSGAASGHVPIMAKVWINSQTAGLVDGRPRTFDSGRLCYDDLPKLSECLWLLDALPVLEQQDIPVLAADPNAAGELEAAIPVHRADLAAFLATEPGDPTKKTLIPGGFLIEIMGTRGLPGATCNYEQTAARILPSGESFIGLSPDAQTGTATITLQLPFASGGAAVWAPAEITDETAILEVEASSDGQEWAPLYRLDAAAMQDEGQHVLPASTLGASTLKIRARLTSRDAIAGPAREGSLRFLDAPPPCPSNGRIEFVKDVVRVLRREQPPVVVPRHFRLVVQPTLLDAHGVSALVLDARRAGSLESDVYAPCELDMDTCRDIGNYPGVIRFWSPSNWQVNLPDGHADMVSGPGWIIFPRMKEPSVALATALAAGKKSLSFPEVLDPSCDLLEALASCSGELALDGIKTLSQEQSLALSAYRGPKLSLAGLQTADCAHSPSETLLRAIVESPGTCTLTGLTELDEATAKVLAGGNKHFVIDDVVSLSAPVAAALSRTDQGLSLNAVTTLDQASAGKLLSYTGEYLSLAGLRDVQCGIDDLPAFDGRRSRSLRSQLMPPLTAGEEAELKRQACLEELEAIFREAVARGIHKEEDREQLFAAASESDEAMQEILEQNRINHPEFKAFSKVRIGDADGTPLDAFVRSAGVFALQPRGGLAVGKNRFNLAVAQSLVRGQKHLKLDCLVDRDLTPDIATVLSAFGKVVSLDGIQNMTPELAAPLAQYKGPLLSLQGVGKLDKAIEKLFEPVVQNGSASLPDAGMFNIATLRTFAKQKVAEEKAKTFTFQNPEQKKDFTSFLESSKKRQWEFQGRANKFQVTAVLLLPDEVDFDNAGMKTRFARAALLPSNINRLDGLAKDAKVVAAAMKDALLAQ
jgi:hypothetical protein